MYMYVCVHVGLCIYIYNVGVRMYILHRYARACARVSCKCVYIKCNNGSDGDEG